MSRDIVPILKICRSRDRHVKGAPQQPSGGTGGNGGGVAGSIRSSRACLSFQPCRKIGLKVSREL